MSRTKNTSLKKRANLRTKRKWDVNSDNFASQSESLSIASEKKILKRLQAFGHAMRHNWRKFRNCVKRVHRKNMRRLTKWLDPRLEPYRSHKLASRQLTTVLTDSVELEKPVKAPAAKVAEQVIDSPPGIFTNSKPNVNESNEPYTPRSVSDFLAVLQRTPHTVLSQHERRTISTIINFGNYHVADLMLPPDEIVYVRQDEVLGPLTLDRLYHSGFSHFPVIDQKEKIVGLLHTTALNSLEIKESSTAMDLLDPKVYYVRADYNLNQVLAAFLRTNCYFFLVIDKFEHIIGLLTYQMLVDFLLGRTPQDSFDRDDDRLAVAKRRLDQEQNIQVSKNEKLRRVAEMQDEGWGSHAGNK